MDAMRESGIVADLETNHLPIVFLWHRGEPREVDDLGLGSGLSADASPEERTKLAANVEETIAEFAVSLDDDGER